MAKNSRAKGTRLELDVAKIFAKTLGLELRRTPLSGGWAKGNPGVHGDVVCVDPGPEAFGYCIECKNVEDWRLESLFTPHHRWFDSWWAQLLRDCPGDKTPLLVFTRAYCPTFVSFPTNIITADHCAMYLDWEIPYITVQLKTGLFAAVMELEAFMEYIL